MKVFLVWVSDLASNFRRHIALASCLIMLLLVLHGRQYVALLFLAPILYSLFPLTSWYAEKLKSTTGNAKRYDVCSFNVEWNARDHELALEYIKNSSSDILILQEVPAGLTIEIHRLKNIFPFQYGEGHSHVMVLSKHHLELLEYLPWPGRYSKRAMHVLCEVEGQRLHVFAVHLQVTRTWRELSIRNQQINTLLDRISEIKEAMLLVGDFNAGTGSSVIRTIERNTDLYSGESLVNYEATWPSKIGCLGVQLDHIYANNEIILNNLKLGPVLESDHRPISCEFSFYDASANLS